MNGHRRAVLATVLAFAAAAAWAVSSGAGSSVASLSFSPREKFEPNGYVRVLVERGGAWEEAASIAADEHLRSRTVDLSSWLSGAGLAVRLVPSGPGAAHLDAALVEGLPPRDFEGRLARKLSAADNDVVEFAEVAGRDLVFAARDRARLVLTVRIEPAVPSAEPFAFPAEDTYRPVAAFTAFYRYRLGAARMAPLIDGSIRGERLGGPFFSETFPSGSGHPDSPTWAWVGDDGSTLYALLDVTADNTLDLGKDYARLHVRTPAGVRSFEVSSREGRWGRSGFEYTDRVGWEHKVYEIAVPLAALGAAGDLELAFTVYGTSAPPAIDWDADANGVDPDSGPSGTTFTFTVKFSDQPHPSAPSRHDLWIDFDGDGVQDAGVPVLPLRGGPWAWIGAVALAVVAMLLATRRRRPLRRAVLLAVAAAALATCAPPEPEIFTMSIDDSGGTVWQTGVLFTVDVPVTASPGTYDFEFIFVDMEGDPVIVGTAAGTHSLVVE